MIRWLLFVVLSLCATASSAHRFAPSLLALQQLPDKVVSVQWRRPLQADASLRPHFSPSCRALDEPRATIGAGAIVERWHIRCSDLDSLAFSVQGLEQSRTSALLRWENLQGQVREQLTRESDVFFVGMSSSSFDRGHGRYLLWGVEHILIGADHLLFVLGLMLLASTRRRLLWWISGFTLGHSITLSLASIGLLWSPPEATEFVIAASILVLALKIPMTGEGGENSAPYFGVLVPIFGLLHGLGFATVLQELGLPGDGLLPALLAFNLGIELGQIAFVLAVYLVYRGWMRVVSSVGNRQIETAPRWLTIYVMGAVSIYWCLDRGLTLVEATFAGPYGVALFS